GGGGGAGSLGQNGSDTTGGNGGTGLPYSISGISSYYAGGGGGGGVNFTGGAGGAGGGGNGGNGNGDWSQGSVGGNGRASTGGGGGGGSAYANGGNGGSGIVIVSYGTGGLAKGSHGNDVASISIPTEYGLSQNYPNPFNPATVINYQLPKSRSSYFVTLKVYDMLGRVVATLVDDTKNAGYYKAIFNASHLSSGIYFARLMAQSDKSNPFVKTIKLLLMK
ncbi:MAG: glycine-rich domain-containing protein, partial [Bacteroidota bacterium]